MHDWLCVFRITNQTSNTPMRTPHLATAMLAAAAMMGGSQGAAMEYTLRPSPDMNTLYAPTLRTARRSKGRVAQTQRQRQKDRRRSWAAGNRKAFLG